MILTRFLVGLDEASSLKPAQHI